MLRAIAFAVLLMMSVGTAHAVTVNVSTVEELYAAVERCNQGERGLAVVLADGTYTLDHMLWVEGDGLSVRSASGNRNAVLIQGHGMDGDVTHVFNVAGYGFTLENVSVGRVSQHGVQFQPEADDPMLRNIRVFDCGEQLVKVAWDDSRPDVSCDYGVLENSLLEYTADFGPQYYIGGIDCHRSEGWVVRGNVFRNIRSPADSPAEHAVHFWSQARDTMVEYNLIINCDRGIGFGLGDRGHMGGVIANNVIVHDGRGQFADVGIGLENAGYALVAHNTILMRQSYPNAIEYRFSGTSAVIANNLANRAIAARDGGQAELVANITNAQESWFVNPAGYDFHLAPGAVQAIDSGAPLADVSRDMDGEARPMGAAPDIGADEAQ